MVLFTSPVCKFRNLDKLINRKLFQGNRLSCACVTIVAESITKQFSAGSWPDCHSAATSVTDLHRGSDYTLQTREEKNFPLEL